MEAQKLMFVKDSDDAFGEVTLATIAGGEAEKMFQREFQKALDNIAGQQTQS